MLHRLLLGLLAMASLTLAGCVHSPQQLSPQPVLNTQLAAVGRGQPVVVRVVDGRPSPTLGSRGGLYPETALISVTGQDVLPKLQAQAEAAVRLLGFTPSPNAPGAPQLTITLAELKAKRYAPKPAPQPERPRYSVEMVLNPELIAATEPANGVYH